MKITKETIIQWKTVFDDIRIDWVMDVISVDEKGEVYQVLVTPFGGHLSVRRFFLSDIENGLMQVFPTLEDFKENYPEEFV